GGVALLAGLALLLAVAPARAQELRYPLGLRGQFTSQGMVVQVVQAGSPAAVAGIQRGDLITKVDSTIVTNQADLVSVINSSGGSVVFTVPHGTHGPLAPGHRRPT